MCCLFTWTKKIPFLGFPMIMVSCCDIFTHCTLYKNSFTSWILFFRGSHSSDQLLPCRPAIPGPTLGDATGAVSNHDHLGNGRHGTGERNSGSFQKICPGRSRDPVFGGNQSLGTARRTRKGQRVHQGVPQRRGDPVNDLTLLIENINGEEKP